MTVCTSELGASGVCDLLRSEKRKTEKTVAMSTPYPEDELLPLSGLQHLLFCERQCALIHIERLWAENYFTATGRILHDRTDTPETRNEHGVRVVRAMTVRSLELGLFGVCDVVEFRDGVPTPVEYKRGKPKSHRADEVQLCAQALCLEEMMDCSIPEADLFYGKTHRRQPVPLDCELRNLTRDIARRFHDLLAADRTPPPVYERAKCSACSLADLCMPKTAKTGPQVKNYLKRNTEDGPKP